MKRLLSLLLVIAMLFGICTVFTACDSTSVSDEDEDEDDDDKKKDDKDEDEEEDEDVEPTYVLNGLKIVLPEDFEVDPDNIYEDEDTASATFIGRDYTVQVSCGLMTGEIAGMDAKEMQDYVLDQMDPDDEDSDVSECDTGTKNKTPYISVINGDETMAMAMSFYVDDDYLWMVRISSNEDSEDYSVDEMVELITGWKYKAPNFDEEEEEATQPGTVPPENSEINDTVIYDKNGITITVVGAETSYSYYTFNLEVQNNSGTDVYLGADHCVINGISTVYNSFYGEAEDGETAEATLTFYLERLEEQNIDRIGDVEFYLYIYNSSYDYIDEGTRVSIQTEDYGYVHNMSDNGQLLFNEAGIRIGILEMVVNGEYDSYMKLYVENNTSEPLKVNLENIIINGWVLPYASGYCTVMPGTYTVDNVDLGDVLDLGITSASQIENIMYNLDAYNSQTYATYYEQAFLFMPFGDEDYVQDVDVSGTVVYDSNGICVMVCGVEEGSAYVDYYLYIHNGTSIPVQIALEDAIINGIQTYDSTYSFMAPGTHAFEKLSLWFKDEANFNSLSDLESVLLNLDVRDSEYYQIFEDTIVLVEK